MSWRRAFSGGALVNIDLKPRRAHGKAGYCERFAGALPWCASQGMPLSRRNRIIANGLCFEEDELTKKPRKPTETAVQIEVHPLAAPLAAP